MKTFFFLLFTSFALSALAQQPRLVVPIGNMADVHWVSFSLDGKIVKTSDFNNKTILWNLDGKELKCESGDFILSFQTSYAPDGKTFLTIKKDTVILMDFSGSELLAFYAEHTCRAVFSLDGKTVYTGSRKGLIKQWDLSGRLLKTSKLDENQITNIDFSPDRKLVLTANGSKTIALWDLSGRHLQTFSGHADQVFNAAFSPDGKSLLVGGMLGLKRWDLTGRGCENVHGYSGGVSAVAFSPDGQLILNSSKDGNFKLADVTGKLKQIFMGGDSENNEIIAFSPDGRSVLAGSDNFTTKLWEVSSAKPPKTLAGHKNEVSSATFSPDGKTILTADLDETVILWDLSGRLLQQFEQLGSVVAFSPDGKAMIAGNADGIPTLFDFSGRVLRDLGPGIESCAICSLKSSYHRRMGSMC